MNRTTLVAVGVFVLLLVGVFATQRDTPERGIERVSFSSLEKDRVDVLEIRGPNEVTLTKNDGQWRVDGVGKDADASMVERALDQLMKVETSDLVTKSEKRFEDLGVSEEKGVKVVAKDGGKELASFILGNGASGGSYLRVDDRVFAAEGIYKGTYDREADSWLDRRVFRGRRIDDVEKLTVALQGQPPFDLVKKDGVWALGDGVQVPEGFRFDKNAARNVASTLVNLRARDIVLDGVVADTGLGEGADAFALTFAKGESNDAGTVTLRLGAAVPQGEEEKDPGQVYAMVDARADEVITLLDSQAQNLRRGLDALRDLKVMDFDPAKATKLSIRGEHRVDLEKKDGAWTLGAHSEKEPDDYEFDPASVMRRLRAVQNARATGVVTDMTLASAGLSRPSAEVVVTLEDGSTARLAFGTQFKDENERDHVYLTGNGDGLVYKTTTWVRDNTTKGLDSFKKQAAPAGGAMSGLDPAALQNLPPEVRKSLQQQMAQQAQQQKMLEQLKQQ